MSPRFFSSNDSSGRHTTILALPKKLMSSFKRLQFLPLQCDRSGFALPSFQLSLLDSSTSLPPPSTRLQWSSSNSDKFPKGRLKVLQTVSTVWLSGGPNYCQSAVLAGRRYGGTLFSCNFLLMHLRVLAGHRYSGIHEVVDFGSNSASADTLPTTADSLTPLKQAGSLYLHTCIL